MSDEIETILEPEVDGQLDEPVSELDDDLPTEEPVEEEFEDEEGVLEQEEMVVDQVLDDTKDTPNPSDERLGNLESQFGQMVNYMQQLAQNMNQRPQQQQQPLNAAADLEDMSRDQFAQHIMQQMGTASQQHMRQMYTSMTGQLNLQNQIIDKIIDDPAKKAVLQEALKMTQNGVPFGKAYEAAQGLNRTGDKQNRTTQKKQRETRKRKRNATRSRPANAPKKASVNYNSEAEAIEATMKELGM